MCCDVVKDVDSSKQSCRAAVASPVHTLPVCRDYFGNVIFFLRCFRLNFQFDVVTTNIDGKRRDILLEISSGFMLSRSLGTETHHHLLLVSTCSCLTSGKKKEMSVFLKIVELFLLKRQQKVSHVVFWNLQVG